MFPPAYLTPEQTLGAPMDIRSDVYRMGVLLYELSTLRQPFPAKSVDEITDYHRKEQLPSPRLVRKGLWKSLEQELGAKLRS